MFLVRDIMYCKPGKARPLVDKFRSVAKISEKLGLGTMRIMTDVSAERYWTVVSEMQVPSLEAYTETSRKSMEIKELQDIMQGYHDLVNEGRREIYLLEE
jgi:hypothetical protein